MLAAAFAFRSVQDSRAVLCLISEQEVNFTGARGVRNYMAKICRDFLKFAGNMP